MKETDHRIIELFKALGSPPRMKIIRILLNGSERVGILAERLGKKSTTISKHLKILRDLELVSFITKENCVYYSIKKDKIEKLLSLAGEIVSRNR